MSDDANLIELLAAFQERAQPLGVIVLRVAAAPAAARAITEWAASLGANRVVLAAEARQRAPALAAELAQRGLRVEPSGPPAVLRDAPLGVSLARLAIAETGSMLVSEPSLDDRAVGMLTLANVILCPTRALAPSLDDAAPVLRALALAGGGVYSTLVTGPSRTADIERTLTVGVQGPGKIMALFVDEL